MNLLGAKLYDPAGAVSKATSSLLALTALDTTNLRLTITVPAHGMVRFKMRCIITGATTCPTVLLGVLNGATVVGRVCPQYENATANAATQNFVLDAEFTATGLTPGSTNFDAAYGVEVVVASTNIKYGGPNNTTTNDAWGGFLFEAWDPQPIPTAAPGAANGLQICGSNAASTYATLTVTGAMSVNGVSNVAQTGDSFAVVKASGTGDNAAIKAKTDLIPAAPASTTNITAGTITTVTNLTNAPTAGDLTATMKASINAEVDSALDTAIPGTPTANSVNERIKAFDDAYTAARGALLDNLDATVSSRLATSGYTAPLSAAGVRSALGLASANLDTQLGTIDDFIDTEIGTILTNLATIAGYIDTEVASLVTDVGTLLARLSAVRAGLLDNLDAAISTRSTYAGADTAGTTTLLSRLTSGRATGLDNLDALVSSRLATAGYTTPPTAAANATAVAATYPANFASLAITAGGVVSADAKAMNGVSVTGAGVLGDEWRPA